MTIKSIICPIGVALALLAGCGQPNAEQPGAPTEETNGAPAEAGLRLDTFKDFPPEIDGCSCYFSADSTAFGKGQFIYVSDYAEVSFIKINGVLTKFVQTSAAEIDSTRSVMTAKSTDDAYELKLEWKAGPQNGDETWLKTGTLNVKDKNGRGANMAFYGECGC